MRYWVVKGKPWNFAEEDYYKPGKLGRWGTGRLPKEIAKGDRIFIWQSSPAKRLVALARLKKVYDEKDHAGKTLFDVVYLTSLLEDQISINELRQYPSISKAAFLKAGPFATVFPLSNAQGESLFRIVALRNPNVWSIWTDIAISEPERIGKITALSILTPPPRLEVIIKRIIRDTNRTKLLKIKYGYRCQVCDERIEISRKRFYAEVHHIRPLGGIHKGLDEEGNMIVLCPNHHAMFDLGIPNFLSHNRIEIGRRRYTLTSKHALDKKSISYHNKQIFGSNI